MLMVEKRDRKQQGSQVSDEGVGHVSLDEPMEECVTQGGEGILSFFPAVETGLHRLLISRS